MYLLNLLLVSDYFFLLKPGPSCSGSVHDTIRYIHLIPYYNIIVKTNPYAGRIKLAYYHLVSV